DGFVDIVSVATGGNIQAWTGPAFAGPVNTLGNVGFSFRAALAVTDINGDFADDIVVTNGFSSDTMNVLLQNFFGSFSAPVSYATDSGPVALAVGDTNQDFAPDVVTINEFSNDFTVFRQSMSFGFQDGDFWTGTNYFTSGFAPQS